MKVTILVEKEFEARYLTMSVAVRYEEENMPADYPFRNGDMWEPTIDIDTGQIVNFPGYNPLDLHMKVCDQGAYNIKDYSDEVFLMIDGYVPNNLVPGSNGDYIEMKINSQGLIENWPKNPNLDDFINNDA